MWLSLLPILLSAAALLFIPGTLVGAAAGIRTPLIVGLAPAISIAIISGTGVAAPVLALPWGLAGCAVLADEGRTDGKELSVTPSRRTGVVENLRSCV